MIASSLQQAVSPYPTAAIVVRKQVLGFHPANDHVSCCTDCGRQAGDARALSCREAGCPLSHGRRNAGTTSGNHRETAPGFPPEVNA